MAVQTSHYDGLMKLSANQLSDIAVLGYKSLMKRRDIGDNDARFTPLCIWGTHGYGKTSSIYSMARRLEKETGKPFPVVMIAGAQLTDPGDLTGAPVVDKRDDDSLKWVTRFMKPDWAATDSPTGILVIDDFNRANSLIIQALMNFLQFYKCPSWGLPKDWIIVLTANPDNGEYSTQFTDDAVLTRMVNYRFKFSLEDWMIWAESAEIDPRGVNFLGLNPEIVMESHNGADDMSSSAHKLSVPRTWTNLFNAITAEPDWATPVVRQYARGFLDSESAVKFNAFITKRMNDVPNINELLDKDTYKATQQKFFKLVAPNKGAGTGKRHDIISLVGMRVAAFVRKTDDADFKSRYTDGLTQFLLDDIIPQDVRFDIVQQLADMSDTKGDIISKSPKLTDMILKSFT